MPVDKQTSAREELLADIRQFAKESSDGWVSFEHDFNGYTREDIQSLHKAGIIEAIFDAEGFTVRLTRP